MNIPKIIQKATKSVVRVFSDYGNGSGFIIDQRGLILTNHHVIGLDKVVIVIFADGNIKIGKVIYSNPYRDIAFIHIKYISFAPIKLNYSQAVNAGEEILAIGHPRDLPYTVTKGIVSYPARIRMQEPGLPYIQFDAPSADGSSGGPLLNLKGEVIGIVCGGVGKTETLNLAIPIHAIRPHLLKVKRQMDWYRTASYCHICGEANDSKETFCRRCGAKSGTNLEIRRMLKDKTIKAKNFSVCKYCGNINILEDEQNAECGGCFNPLNISPSQHKNKTPKTFRLNVICGSCKSRNNGISNYCINCGSDLQKERRNTHGSS